MYTFASASKVGKWAVERVERHLKAATSWEIQNVEDDPFYRSLDVDLVVLPPDPQERAPLLLEVKGDRYLSGNAFIETTSNTTRGTPGCLTYTAADYVIYYFVKAGYALWIPVPALKEWIARRAEDFPEAYPRTATTQGKEMFRAKGRPVPVSVLLQEIPGIYQWHFLEEMGDKDDTVGKVTARN